MDQQSTSSSVTESLSLPLRLWPNDDTKKQSLSSVIQRINEQKGSFRNVTEASLEEEIQALQSGDGEDGEVSDAGDKDDSANQAQDGASRTEFLRVAKEELLKQLG